MNTTPPKNETSLEAASRIHDEVYGPKKPGRFKRFWTGLGNGTIEFIASVLYGEGPR